MSSRRGPGPAAGSEGRRFSKLVCFVGNDRPFGIAAISILLERGMEIRAIVGETANSIANELPASPNAQIIAAKRPWETPAFESLGLGSDALGVNCGFDYIIAKSVLDHLVVVNTHPAALPFNRGCHHSFWGIMDRTPLGATLHWMTEGLDEGPIIATATFADDGYMSAGEIQRRSNALCLTLLRDHIEDVVAGTARSIPQGPGSYHGKADIIAASTLDARDTIDVSRLFDLCRATNNKRNGFIIVKDGRRFRIKIDAIEEVG